MAGTEKKKSNTRKAVKRTSTAAAKKSPRATRVATKAASAKSPAKKTAAKKRVTRAIAESPVRAEARSAVSNLTREMVAAATAACEDKKGEETRILELDPADAGFTDFFLITSGSNERQTQSIADEVELRLKREFNTYPNSVEGKRLGEWILLDYVDFVVHVFLKEKRAFYDIERLRKSARPVEAAQLQQALKEKTAGTRRRVAAKRTT